MKLLLCLLVTIACALAALTPAQIQKLEPISKECQAESGVTAETISKFRTKTSLDNSEISKKHAVCVAKKSGLVNDSGDVLIDNLKLKLHKVGATDETIAKIEACAQKKQSIEETVLNLTKCVYSNQPNFSPAD